ncbi:MAG: ABC transporter ATP-binding protein [Candidatus Dormibacteraeota bacterium]|nr:ABC transporter ATP-binding protein [Candidatus Dormibacteraeota bacterium]
MKAVVETDRLGKRYGDLWALRNCTLALPAGSAVALVGPNGAGKTTLLQLLVGLLRPSEGRADVCGHSPFDEAAQVLPRVAFVAQDQPLYNNLTGVEHFTLGRKLNPRWHDLQVRERLRQLRIPLDRRVGRLSGGQRSQIALALSLAKQADLVVLDEPLASLDPLARQEFLQTLMEAQVDSKSTVLLSSHIVGGLERVCDFLVILATANVQIAVGIDEALATHRRLIGPSGALPSLSSLYPLIFSTLTAREATAVIRTNAEIVDPAWESQPLSLEEIVLAYLSRSRSDEIGLSEEVLTRAG